MVRGGGLDLSENKNDQGAGESETKVPAQRSPATTKAKAAARDVMIAETKGPRRTKSSEQRENAESEDRARGKTDKRQCTRLSGTRLALAVMLLGATTTSVRAARTAGEATRGGYPLANERATERVK